jgi:hypothetical protein
LQSPSVYQENDEIEQRAVLILEAKPNISNLDLPYSTHITGAGFVISEV